MCTSYVCIYVCIDLSAEDFVVFTYICPTSVYAYLSSFRDTFLLFLVRTGQMAQIKTIPLAIKFGVASC